MTHLRRSARLVLPLLLAALASAPRAQAPIPGYAERVRGEVLHYHSPLPDVEDALLVRSEDSRRSIAWRTAPVPADHTGDHATFVWMFGIDSGGPRRFTFDLRVDGESWLRFQNPASNDVRDWTVRGRDGAELGFRATMVDRFDDLMGFATLRLPRAAFRPGEPVTLSVVGESAGDRTWYMTFLEPVRSRAALEALPSLRRGAEGPYRTLRLSVVHLGEPVRVAIETSWAGRQTASLRPGGNELHFPHAEVQAETAVRAALSVDGRVIHDVEATLRPVRPWHVDLVQHTHTDVGYTRPQTEILPEHLRFLDTALELCDATDDLPDDARFRWTCEASWAVREYLESRAPEQVARFVERVQAGRIEVTGMFLNMSEVVDEASYAAFLQPIRALRAAGLRVDTMMQNDINGAAWCLADYAEELGVRYLTMGQHGHRALIPFEVPTAFWWQAPSGRRLLAYRADHYQTGNFWGVHTGRVEAVERELLHYLEDLEAKGYPYDRVAVQHSGYPTDNSPPSMAASALVKAWNERFVWPRLRCALASDFPRWVEAGHGGSLQVVRAAWPDWWTDGFGAAPRESAAARRTQATVLAAESLLAFERLAGLPPPEPLRRELEEIRDALLFYGEHTFGAAESVTEPFGENSQVQWMEKAAYAWDAVKRAALLGEGALGRLLPLLGAAPRPRLVLWNGLGAPRSGYCELYADHELLPPNRPFRIVDGDGRAVPAQLLRSRAEGSYWAIHAGTLPAFGLAVFTIEGPDGSLGTDLGAPAHAETPSVALENAHYRVEVDPTTGGIASLVDKALGAELVDAGAEWRFGQVIHERLGNRAQLEAFMLTDFERTPLRDVAVGPIARGPVWDALTVTGELPGCEAPGGLRLEVRLFHAEKRVELHYLARKRRELGPEAIYVALPFGVPDAQMLLETLGGVVAPERGEVLPGTASDWQAIQSFVAARGRDLMAVVASDEIPLVQLGAINTGRFMRTMRVDRPHAYSWVMNNYWTTNFPAAPEGDLRWHYAITSTADRSYGAATRFGLAARVPVLARVLRPGGETAGAGGAPATLPRLPRLPPNVALVAARVARSVDGVVLHLRETDGRPAQVGLAGLTIDGAPAQARLVNVIEDVLGDLGAAVELAPFESRFVLLTAPE